MELILDHVFLLTQEYEDLAEKLIALGLTEGPPRHHPGQGTANRRFLFSNNMLELLYVCDLHEAQVGPAKKMLLPQRLDSHACPFGLIFRRKHEYDRELPFAGWSYQPDYFSAPKAFHIGNNSEDISNPLCIYAPFLSPDLTISGQKTSGESINRGLSSMLEVKLVLPKENYLAAEEYLKNIEGFKLEKGDQYLLKLYVESEKSTKHDFRPHYPLIINC